MRCAKDGCGRVFHVTCVAHILQDIAANSPGGIGASAGKWMCPLHRCARCGKEGEEGGGGGDNKGDGDGSEERLWQCTWCSVAFCMKHLPSQLATAGRKARVADANQCVHCRSPSPRSVRAVLGGDGIPGATCVLCLVLPYNRKEGRIKA